MNNKGFSLIELLGSLIILGVILGIGLYTARGTLATTVSILNNVSENEIYDASKLYVVENSVEWIDNVEEYACLTVLELVDAGYFDNNEVDFYKNNKIKLIRDKNTKVINDIKLVDICE